MMSKTRIQYSNTAAGRKLESTPGVFGRSGGRAVSLKATECILCGCIFVAFVVWLPWADSPAFRSSSWRPRRRHASGRRRSRYTLVTVDFRVVGRDGTPVLDLKPEEVVLKVGSRAREVVALELIKAGGGSVPGAPAAARGAGAAVHDERADCGRPIAMLRR